MGQLLLVLIGALLVTAVARSRDIAAPLLLVLTGLAVSFIPGISSLYIEPDVLLTVVLPPLLYTAALESSYLNFRARIRAIAHHGVLQVLATTFVIGWLADALIPVLPAKSALVLGAVISPPDAVSATAIGRRLKLPRPIMTVLRGESLINDAAALTAYRMSIAAVVATTPTLAQGVVVFVLAVVVGLVVGLSIGVLAQAARTRVPDVEVATSLGVLVPFVAYLLAEQLHGSGVLAVIAAGLYVGHHRPRARAAGRLQEQTVWASLNLLLESLVFAFIGLQLTNVVDEVVRSGHQPVLLSFHAVVILLAVMAFRVVWMFGSNYLPGLSHLILPASRTAGRWRRTAVLAWTGMRGVVTLAAAGAIPNVTESGAPFPARGVIQYVAFVVAVGTIVIQGSTLPWLIRKLGASDPAEAERDDYAEAEARRIATDSALEYLDQLTPADLGCTLEEHQRVTARMRALVRHQGEAAAEQVGRTPDERQHDTSRIFTNLRRKLLDVERAAMADERDAGNIDDEVLRRVLRELDLQDAALETSWRNR